MIYVKQQSPCIGECQTPRPSVDVTFHANLELFIMGKGRKKKASKQDRLCCIFPYATLNHLSFNCDRRIPRCWKLIEALRKPGKVKRILCIIKYANQKKSGINPQPQTEPQISAGEQQGARRQSVPLCGSCLLTEDIFVLYANVSRDVTHRRRPVFELGSFFIVCYIKRKTWLYSSDVADSEE